MNMNRLSVEKRRQIVASLVEGNSIRATARMVGCSKNTVTKLLVDLGTACAEYQDGALRRVAAERIQCDEIWSFCHSKQKNVPEDKKGQFGFGDVWTFTAIDADSKLMLTWLVGPRTAEAATEFMMDLRERVTGRPQITTDGHAMYRWAVDRAFGTEVDFAQLVKKYASDPQSEVRYSPAVCVAAEKAAVWGNPDPDHISTSYVEGANLTMRMGMRRFTRLTNAFSKKVENLMHAVSLHFMYYNFVRIHQSLRVTPAMAAGIATRPWEIEDILKLLDSN
jgi:IS1 family transposase